MNSTKPDATIAFSLDPSSGAPIYRQIIRQVEYAVLSGRLAAGDRLPTIRALAVALKANPNTIARAYGELEIRGILTTQVGSGTYISGRMPAPEDGAETADAARQARIRETVGRFLREMRDLGVGDTEIAELVREAARAPGEAARRD